MGDPQDKKTIEHLREQLKIEAKRAHEKNLEHNAHLAAEVAKVKSDLDFSRYFLRQKEKAGAIFAAKKRDTTAAPRFSTVEL